MVNRTEPVAAEVSVGADRGADEAGFYARIEEHAYRPLWTRPEPSPEPAGLTRPAIWRYGPGRSLLLEAGERMGLGGVGGIDRRVLTMTNPSVPAQTTTRTLSSALQLVRAGETAPSHRHTLAALRFIIEGDGGSTIVEGVAVPMEPGDLVLTPAWSWHGHVHEGGETMVWLDVLDAPLVGALDVGFHEEFATPKQLQPARRTVVGAPRTARREDLLPTSSHVVAGERQPLLRYGLEATVSALEELRRSAPPQQGSYALTFTDPSSGGPVMTTIDASARLIPAGRRTPRRRDTANRIYHVVRGSGFSEIDGEQFAWEFGDTFCVPSWCSEEHGSDDGDVILFVASDEPAKRALGMYRVDSDPLAAGRGGLPA